MEPMNYEGAIRYVFDRCGRFGTAGANVDVFTSAQHRNEWSDVAQALSRAIERIQADATGIAWTENERSPGGIEPNFSHTLQRAAEALKNTADIQNAFEALSLMTHAMRALAFKASGAVPEIYRGDESATPTT